jgi:hypothetical protein
VRSSGASRHFLRLFTKLLLAISLVPAAVAQGDKVITRDELVEMFDSIARDAKWDMSKPMLWGYFFTDSDKAQLERVAPLLQKQGYRYVEIFLADKDDQDERDLWFLHVERVEVHTPDSLYERNRALYKFADDHGLDSYDGMDVGPVATTH